MLRSRLPEIVVEIDQLVQEGVEGGARSVAERARQRVPVRTGKLRDAIHTEVERFASYVVAGDDDVWYGHLVEHGTARTAPQPFLVPSLDENRTGIVRDVKDRLRGL